MENVPILLIDRIAATMDELSSALKLLAVEELTSSHMTDVENLLDDAKDNIKAACLLAEHLARETQKSEGY